MADNDVTVQGENGQRFYFAFDPNAKQLTGSLSHYDGTSTVGGARYSTDAPDNSAVTSFNELQAGWTDQQKGIFFNFVDDPENLKKFVTSGTSALPQALTQRTSRFDQDPDDLKTSVTPPQATPQEQAPPAAIAPAPQSAPTTPAPAPASPAPQETAPVTPSHAAPKPHARHTTGAPKPHEVNHHGLSEDEKLKGQELARLNNQAELDRVTAHNGVTEPFSVTAGDPNLPDGFHKMRLYGEQANGPTGYGRTAYHDQDGAYLITEGEGPMAKLRLTREQAGVYATRNGGGNPDHLMNPYAPTPAQTASPAAAAPAPAATAPAATQPPQPVQTREQWQTSINKYNQDNGTNWHVDQAGRFVNTPAVPPGTVVPPPPGDMNGYTGTNPNYQAIQPPVVVAAPVVIGGRPRPFVLIPGHHH